VITICCKLCQCYYRSHLCFIFRQKYFVVAVYCIFFFLPFCTQLFVQNYASLPANYGNTLRGKTGVHAFGYNSVESEPIWMKSGAL